MKNKNANETKLFVSEDGFIVLPLHLGCYAEFYEAIDNSKTVLSSNITQYIEERIAELPKKLPIKLVFYCPELSNTKRDCAKNAIRTYYSQSLKHHKSAFLFFLLSTLLLLAISVLLAVFFLYKQWLHAVFIPLETVLLFCIVLKLIPNCFSCLANYVLCQRLLLSPIIFKEMPV